MDEEIDYTEIGNTLKKSRIIDIILLISLFLLGFMAGQKIGYNTGYTYVYTWYQEYTRDYCYCNTNLSEPKEYIYPKLENIVFQNVS